MTSYRKRPRDPNQLAKVLVDIVAGEIEDREPPIDKRPRCISGSKAAVERALEIAKGKGGKRAMRRGGGLNEYVSHYGDSRYCDPRRSSDCRRVPDEVLQLCIRVGG